MIFLLPIIILILFEEAELDLVIGLFLKPFWKIQTFIFSIRLSIDQYEDEKLESIW